MKKYLILLILLTTTTTNLFANPITRPPQYVLLAFDGSFNIDMWSETLELAKKNNIKFSYFLSGVYFLLDSNRMEYTEPTKGPGKSSIGFAGDSKENLVKRVAFVNQAFDEGHTIASHANGHFDGSSWNEKQWQLEFKEFIRLIFDVFAQPGLEIYNKPNPYHFSSKEITGFRAPLLGFNSNLYLAMRKNNFAYDTSQTRSMDYWPELINGLWNFPLADIRLADTGKYTISMDYNIYVSQSGGEPDLKNAAKYREQTLKTYMAYFNYNYFGNRAPVHIGHHFSKWNGGAYWYALSDFIKNVCILPEVKCVNYQSLLGFMNTLSPALRKVYQNGHFDKLSAPAIVKKSIESIKPIDLSIKMEKNSEEINILITGKDAPTFLKNATYFWSINNKEILKSRIPKIKMTDLPYMDGDYKLSAIVKNKNLEVLKTTHIINTNSIEAFLISDEDLEKRAIHGDLPEAHAE